MVDGREAAAAQQKRHYEEIHGDYERHYYDRASTAFRRRFVEDVLFRGLELDGQDVADLACGSGHNSLALLERYPQARPTGFDISPPACEAYRSRVRRPCHELDLMSGAYSGPLFDAAMIHGGLHHCVADLPGTLRTIGGLLRPGGFFLMVEPNREYILEGARRLWYRLDRYFAAESEAALSHEEILRSVAPLFEGVDVRYRGGPSYFLIFNSLLFRVPVAAKSAIAPALFLAEAAYNWLPGRFWFPYFIARWRRR